MKELYIAINGDDVGNAIGSAVASDDRETLGNKISILKEMHRQIDDWIEQCGGEVVTSSGDEGIYKIPVECLDHLEDLRAQYAEHTGHTLTIGVGETMSQAAKALIYGKINSKDTIVEYEEGLEEAISGQDEMGPEGYEQQNEGNLPAEEEMQYQRDRAAEEEAGMVEEEEEADKDTEEIIDEASEDPDHEQDMTEEEERAHDAAENELDEMDDDIVEADEEASMEDIDDEDGEEDYQVGEDENMEDGEEVDESDHADLLAEMIHAHMSGKEEPEMGEEDMREVPDEELDKIRTDIAASLNDFKQNRDMILQMEQAAPQMYNSLMVMLRSMISMARKLGLDAEKDAEDQQAREAAEQEFPEAAPEGQRMEMSEKK